MGMEAIIPVVVVKGSNVVFAVIAAVSLDVVGEAVPVELLEDDDVSDAVQLTVPLVFE